jgi:hypothetical protein
MYETAFESGDELDAAAPAGGCGCAKCALARPARSELEAMERAVDQALRAALMQATRRVGQGVGEGELEDFSPPGFRVTVKSWHGPFNFARAKKFLAANPAVRAGVYIIVLRGTPQKVGQTERFVQRVGKHEQEYPPETQFYFGRVDRSRLHDVETALARIFYRAGYTLPKHTDPHVPANVEARVEIRNILPPAFRGLLQRAYQPRRKIDAKGQDIKGPYDIPPEASQGTLVLTKKSTPIWEV